MTTTILILLFVILALLLTPVVAPKLAYRYLIRVFPRYKEIAGIFSDLKESDRLLSHFGKVVDILSSKMSSLEGFRENSPSRYLNERVNGLKEEFDTVAERFFNIESQFASDYQELKEKIEILQKSKSTKKPVKKEPNDNIEVL